MTNEQALELAASEGFFAAAVIGAEEIVFNGAFRKYCADNLCGNYGANYSCPPDCGEVEQMRARMQRYTQALVLQTKWKIPDFRDKKAVWSAKHAHNEAMFRVIECMEQAGCKGLMAGASCCTLCEKCAILENAPCKFPEKRFSCLSAYCVDVKALAERCGMEYFCADGSVAFFGVFAFE